jgi:hypothetical protein
MKDYEVLVSTHTGEIVFNNFDEIKDALTTQMEIYKNLEVTEENMKTSKKDVATLRKIKKAIEDRRKEIKKSFLQPYEQFEGKVKELTGLIDEPVNMISDKLAIFEEDRIYKKRIRILELWNENCKIPGAEINFYEDESWENAATSESTIISAISEFNVEYETGLNTLNSFSDVEPEEIKKAIGIFVRTKLDINAAISEINHYRESKKLFEEQERIRAEREAQKKIEEAQRKAEEAKEKEEEKSNSEEIKEIPGHSEQDLSAITFPRVIHFEATDAQFESIMHFFAGVGITVN